LAEGIDRIAAAHPKAIGLGVLLSEPEQSMGLAEVRRLESRYKELVTGRKIVQRGADFDAEFASSTIALDSDSRLLASLSAAGNVVMRCSSRRTRRTAISSRRRSRCRAPRSSRSGPVDAGLVQEKMIWPLAPFSAAAAGLGHSNLFTRATASSAGTSR